jgi:CCR4-NOT transcription complex subunit 7/8
MIQLGITLFAPDGSLPPINPTTSTNAQSNYMGAMIPSPYTWQFNFQFSLNSDMYAQESTTMLTKAGIDFSLHEKNGIDPHEFGALLISSGLVLDPDVHWISFHSGYDFGYLMKIMLAKELPDDESEFHKLLMVFFPSLYDIKFLLKHAGRNGTVNNNQALTPDAQSVLQKLSTKSGLQDIAEELDVRRVGIAHQAGSDSLVTGQIYFKMKEKVFGGTIEEGKYSGQVWGLNAQVSGMGSRDLNTPNMNGATFYNQNGAPSTPQTANVGIASVQGQTHTPQPQGSMGGTGHLTPGGGGFGQFQYARA